MKTDYFGMELVETPRWQVQLERHLPLFIRGAFVGCAVVTGLILSQAMFDVGASTRLAFGAAVPVGSAASGSSSGQVTWIVAAMRDLNLISAEGAAWDSVNRRVATALETR